MMWHNTVRRFVSACAMVAMVAVAAACGKSASPPRPEPGSARGGEGAASAPLVAGAAGLVLAVGRSHGCVLRGGAVWCWGDNQHGELGDGGRVSRDHGAAVPGIDDAVAVGVEDWTSCALRRGGEVVCWGGTDAATRASHTVLHDAVQLSSTGGHSCAVTRSGKVMCWGQSDRAAHGAAADWVEMPREVAGVSGAVEVAAGWSRSCARLVSGAVTCWGQPWGLQGEGTPAPFALPGVTDAAALWIGLGGPCVRRTGGEVRCERYDENGEEMVEVADWAGATAVSIADTAACAVEADGDVSCWTGQPHHSDDWGVRLSEGYPAHVVQDGQAVAAGESLCVLSRAGEVSCRGNRPRFAPAAVEGLSDAVDLVGDGAGPCAQRRDGTVMCWGYGLSEGPSTPRVLPTFPKGARMIPGRSHLCALDKAQRLTCNYDADSGPHDHEVPAGKLRHAGWGFYGCAARADGRVICWGANHAGELGITGPTEARASAPVVVPDVLDAVEVAAGYAVACARLRSGEVSCWGSHNGHSIGGGGVSDATYLTMSNHFACVIHGGGAVRCWGGSITMPRMSEDQAMLDETAVDVPGIRDAVDVDVDDSRMCIVRASGKLVCAGNIGAVDAPGPGLFEVPGIDDARRVILQGISYVCVLRANGQVVCWGNSKGGVLGDGSHERLTPVRMATP